KLRVSFVRDGIESAMAQAKAAAGEKDVTVVGGADTARQCIRAGLADELEIGIAPVLLGEGLRVCEGLGSGPIELGEIRGMEYAELDGVGRWSLTCGIMWSAS